MARVDGNSNNHGRESNDNVVVDYREFFLFPGHHLGKEECFSVEPMKVFRSLTVEFMAFIKRLTFPYLTTFSKEKTI